ncbi:hypothetical protein BN938_0631 [Mucinivorans hirudinis]|uniref:Uncharacterized protein n=1 Tax=Mucinivorans hirudinis TaxID=1433126 RepID=A0A060R6M1_9BACT|nr:hypothetical protein BN938_0631 [Mucinivorans hirudinis]
MWRFLSKPPQGLDLATPLKPENTFATENENPDSDGLETAYCGGFKTGEAD